MTTIDRRLNESGFGLTVAVLLIAVMAALSLFGVTLQIQERRTQLRNQERTLAFYAAETGVVRGLENWTTPDVATSGESWLVHQGTLASGATYRVEATLLDDASHVHGLMSVRAVGTSPHGYTRESAMLVATVPLGSPVQGALRTIGKVKIAGQAEVSGWDTIPDTWQDDCPPALEPSAGVTLADTTKLTHSGASSFDGDPPLDENSDTTNYFEFGDLSYDEVASWANIVISDGTVVSGGDPAPSYTAAGACDTSDDRNWGDPENDNMPCSDWFPVIHTQGSMTFSSDGAGQGILLVDGDLSICGGATFYGPVVVKGSIKTCGSGFRLIGGVVAGESDLNPSGGVVVGASKIQYSSCVVERAISRSRAGRPKPLAERPWFSGR
ncbi:MAG: hypothetical protein GWN99_11230 [Gemmatimonadetes bacterium]|uniref:Type 4 fimbrial biogenesis protein PilX N-terminal domain-containing protein n=1 Tax=Candidatus Kutchimonas denitrificans TaxID=3056748 RepID=A0AAE5CB56_9BACT|nr:hypothetical protein [Gemmatimonadota bacterium]NIR74055.1 hypothetical protein [Candidatus Kutchimonas denitrificans]NIS01617.1 hypothetical protein [Gemmatimonadota bacterium]NIT67355.1 hypothetical protein [Gemmatimonadota bacterium]NIU52718.1 hypothetical protein [Gemmatimonadota bacterium]